MLSELSVHLVIAAYLGISRKLFIQPLTLDTPRLTKSVLNF